MTEIERKALAMAESILPEEAYRPPLFTDIRIVWNALCLSIEQHEAFRQEVSDALIKRGYDADDLDFSRFIITKPDPLVEVLKDADDMVRVPDAPSYPDAIRAALAKRGLEIREKSK